MANLVKTRDKINSFKFFQGNFETLILYKSEHFHVFVLPACFYCYFILTLVSISGFCCCGCVPLLQLAELLSHHLDIMFIPGTENTSLRSTILSSSALILVVLQAPHLLSLTCAVQRPLSAPVSDWPGCDDVAVGNQSSGTPSAPLPPSPLSLRTGSWGPGGRCGEGLRCKIAHRYPGCLWSQCPMTAPLGRCCGRSPGDAGFSVVCWFYPEAPETCSEHTPLTVICSDAGENQTDNRHDCLVWVCLTWGV